MSKNSGIWVLVLLIVLGSFLMFYISKSNQQSINDSGNKETSSAVLEFESAQNNKKPVWLLFRTNHCPYCVELKRIFDELKPQYEGKIVFIDVNLDDAENYELGKVYQIKYVPVTYIYDKDGNVSFEKGGLLKKETLLDELDKVLVE